MSNFLRVAFSALAILFFIPVYSQVTIVTGTVTDKESGEPIPYANVVVDGKFHGTVTGLDGSYRLELRGKTDSLVASSLGYVSDVKAVGQQAEQIMHFQLQSESFNIDEIVVRPGEDPVAVFFKKIVAAKSMNNPANFSTFQYESYTKYEIDLENITPKDIDKNILLKGFDFLKDYIDTMREEGLSILPIFFIEQISDNYEQSNPRKTMERVKGQKMTMLRDNPVITDMISNVNQHFNIYENLMTLLGKNFISPIADYGFSIYKYSLNEFDTLYIEGEPHFTLKFRPKRKGENAFSGLMAVNINNYAVRSIEATIPVESNVGFVRDFQFVQEFIPFDLKTEVENERDYIYVPSKESIKMRLTANIGKGAMLIARKHKSYKSHQVNETLDENVFDPFKIMLVEDSAYLRSNSFWDSVRHEKLLDSEAGIYEMVDSLKRTSKFKIIKYTVSTLGNGYAKIGGVGIGHVANLFSRNQIEGWRFRLGFRTNRDFSERVNLEGYLAYGINDNRFKYGGKMIFIISKKPWHKLTLSGRTDIDLMSRHAEEMDKDNVFTLIQKRNVTQRLYNIEEGKIVYDNEFYKDMTSYLTVQYRHLKPFFPFFYENEGTQVERVITSEVGYAIRWQHKSRQLPGTFDRDAKANKFLAQFRKKTDFPVVWVKYLAGLPNLGNSIFTYHDLSIGLQGDVTVTAKQSIYYNLWVGKIFGTLPFLLLKNPEGNFHHVHNKYLFNNMNLLEFTADQYASLNFQYFFGGWIGDRIPLIKKLKWRAVATTNVFAGTLTDENKEFNSLNNIGVAFPVPYVESGFAIENILKIIRIDCIWRVTQRDRPEAYKFGVYASLFIKV